MIHMWHRYFGSGIWRVEDLELVPVLLGRCMYKQSFSCKSEIAADWITA